LPARGRRSLGAGATLLAGLLLVAGPGGLAHAQGLFAPTTPVGVTDPVAVAVGDLNRDGRPDLVVASFATSRIAVFLGQPDGSLAPAGLVATGSGPRSVALGDLDRDGILDAVTANAGDSSISILRGLGNGSFAPRADLFTVMTGGAQAVALTDMDRNGTLDAVVVYTEPGQVKLLLGNGDRTFNQSDFRVIGTDAAGLAVLDLDRDGLPDVAVANPADGTVTVLLNRGGGSFGFQDSFLVGATPVAVSAGDVNGDGLPDLVVADAADGTARVLSGNGDGSFDQAGAFPAGTAPAAVALADVNLDGQLDALVAGTGVSLLIGRGDGTFRFPIAAGSGAFAALAVADVSRDGRPDVVATSPAVGQVIRLLNRTPVGRVAFDAPVETATLATATALALGDLDGDGRLDAVVASVSADSRVSVFLGAGDGTLVPGVTLPTGAGPRAVGLADLDGDDQLDLVTTNTATNTVTVRFGDGSGSFGARSDLLTGGVPGAPRGLAIADVDRDGVPDIMVVNQSPSSAALLRGLPNGAFASAVLFGVGSLPRAIALGDLDRDGRLDAVTANEGAASVSVLLGDPLDIFAAASTVPTGAGPVAVAVGDLDRDGRLDVVTANAGTNTVSVLLGNGDGTFRPRADFAAGGGVIEALTLADADRDGRLDVLVARSGANTVSLLRGNGDGSLAAAADVVLAGSHTGLAVGDLDRDGAPDLVATRSPNAVAVARGSTRFTLTVARTGTGSGTVTSTPPGIACGGDCSEAYVAGTTVALIATPAPGSVRVGFTGPSDCADGVVRMVVDVTCTVEFSTAMPAPGIRSTTLVSRGIGGIPSDGGSRNPSLSADGRVVAFQSTATNLTGSCTNGLSQIYVLDRATGRIACVTVSPAGGPGNGASVLPALSADGSVVAFQTTATNLVAGCVAGASQVVVFDLVTRARTCLSAAPDGTPGNGESGAPAMTGDGTMVTFQSAASNLAPGCGNGHTQVLAMNRATGARACVSADAGGAGNAASAAPAISDDGQVIAFESRATNLAGGCAMGMAQIVIADTAAGTLTCGSVGPGGFPANADSRSAALSPDGVRLAFVSAAGNLAEPCSGQQIYELNRATGVLRCVTLDTSVTPPQPGNGPSDDPAFSGDGLQLVFVTTATNLAGGAALRTPGFARQIPGLSQILMSNAVQNAVQQLTNGSGTVSTPQVSRDGTRIGFSSTATNETDDDPDGGTDVFLVDLAGNAPADRVIVFAPGNGIQLPLLAPTPLTFRWSPLALPGRTLYGLEFSGANLAFSNPNGTGPDPVNGFGGAGGAFVTADERFDVLVPTELPPGNYQVRVIGLTSSFQTVGVFSDAITVILGVVPIPPDARPTMTALPPGAVLVRGTAATFSWSVIPGVALYLIEATAAGQAFSNPNGTAPDPTAFASGIVAGTSVTVVIPPGIPPGPYQVRVLSLDATGQPVGTASDALTVTVQ
jgi:Tol biopolymer transport system component